MWPPTSLLPRSTPTACGVPPAAVAELLDRLGEVSVECHSIMVVHRGHVVAEGWWAPYSADRPHLLYSLTKSFTAIAVGIAVTDGLLSLDDRVADVLPDHVREDVPEQARRLTVHHLLTMTVGHGTDSLQPAWELEPEDLTAGFLRVPFVEPEGTRHVYDNATTYVLARMVERVTGRPLEDLLDERLFGPMGIEHAEWDRVAGGATFGFHGLHLTTEAVAAFGELLLRDGRWEGRQLVPAEWVRLATSCQVATVRAAEDRLALDSGAGYGYQFWMSRDGFRGEGSFEQYCLVYPEHDLVVALTAGDGPHGAAVSAVRDCLLPAVSTSGLPAVGTVGAAGFPAVGTVGAAGPPGVGAPSADDYALAGRLRRLTLGTVEGTAGPARGVAASIDASAPGSALPDATTVTLEPADGGWHLTLGDAIALRVGHGEWVESRPLGRPVVATGAWQDGVFVADLFVITSPHRVRLVLDDATRSASATWSTVPLTSPSLELHLRSPLMTRPDVA